MSPPRTILSPCAPTGAALALPLLPARVTCGFPSPAEDFYGQKDTLDLNSKCVDNPLATFFAQADTGESMVGFGIFPGDLLVVDRSKTARSGDIVLAVWEGGYTVKQLQKRRGRLELHSGHPDHAPIVVPPDTELEVWGVVTWTFKQLRRR